MRFEERTRRKKKWDMCLKKEGEGGGRFEGFVGRELLLFDVDRFFFRAQALRSTPGAKLQKLLRVTWALLGAS